MLIDCPECGKRISDAAAACPQCGFAVKKPEPPTVIVPQREWSPGAAAVLSLLIPGAGQIYKGKLLAGLLWLVFVPLGYHYLPTR